MQVLRLNASTIIPAVAVSVNGKKEKYYNIKHGTVGKSLWCYSMFLFNSHFKHNENVPEKQLIGNNYSIAPISKRGEYIKDERGNRLYNVVVDRDTSHYNNMLIFWDIPNFNYTQVYFKLTGSVNLVAQGINGITKDTTEFISPAPVLEVLGNCVLEWFGINSENKKVYQRIDIVNQKVIINDILTEQ